MTDNMKPAPATTPDSENTDAETTMKIVSGKKNLSSGKLLVWATVIAFLAILGWGLVEATAGRPDGTAPKFDMQFFEGYGWGERQSASLTDFDGKVVVLNFWASWCAECYTEAEVLEETWQAYADKDVIIVGVAYADAENKSKGFLEQFNITYPNAPDLRSLISSKYEITGVPETFFINKKGEVVHIQTGPVTEVMLTTLLDQMLVEG
jgi:cytochrome c biogenesis protein CcmG/thiol:disulfide interchange protein DsbE